MFFRKNKILFATTFLLCLLIAACEKSPDKADSKEGKITVISGAIKNLKGAKVYLQRMGEEKLINVDSAEVKEDGSLELKASVPEPDFYVLKVNDSIGQLLILDTDKLEVRGDAQNFSRTFKVEGSKATNEYLNFNERMRQHTEEENNIKNKIPTLLQNKDMQALEVMGASLKQQQKYTKDFVKSYIDSIVPSIAIFNMLGYLNIDSDFDYLVGLSKKMETQLPNSKYTKLLSGEISKMISMQQKLQETGVPVGALAPEIALPNPEGKIIRLSSFKGKIVLLDFWASWCGPCRAENPNVVSMYRKYKDKGFDILSVSLDKDKSQWLRAIQKDGLMWTHVSDLKFWESSVVPLYSIEGIPATFLLDKEGKVIAKNLRGAELENKLKEVLP